MNNILHIEDQQANRGKLKTSAALSSLSHSCFHTFIHIKPEIACRPCHYSEHAQAEGILTYIDNTRRRAEESLVLSP